MRILIAGLGAPWNLEDRTYSFRPTYGEDEWGPSISESCLSILPIYEGLSKLKGEGNLRIFIVGTDSIVDYTPGRKNSSSGKNNSKCKECFEKAYAGSKIFEEYKSLLEEARRLYRDTLICLGLKDSRVVVAPTYGRVGGKFEFRARPRDALSIPLLEIGLKVYGLSEKMEIEGVYDDLTHGINYVATMAFQLSRMISSLLLLASDSQEKSFTAYNSEATHKGDTRTLSIEPVYEERVGILYYLYQLFPKSGGGLAGKLIAYRGGGNPPGEFIDASNSFSKTTSRVMNIVTSIAYPFPLLLAHLVENYHGLNDEIKRSLEKAFEAWRDLTEIKRTPGGDRGIYRVIHNVSIDPWLVYAYLLALFSYRRAKGILEGSSAGGSQGFPVKALEELNRKVYSKVTSSYYYIIANELSQIRIRAREKGVDENWVSLKTLFGGKPSSAEPRDEGDWCLSERNIQPNVRVMIAHAGLQRELVCVRRSGDDYVLKYVEGNGISFLEKITGIFKGHTLNL